MSRLVFGQDPPPPASKVPMAYIARAACGHIVIATTDSRASSLADFVAEGLAGLMLERVPVADVKAEGLCPCPKPEQLGAFA
jgi:hypothetical protein